MQSFAPGRFRRPASARRSSAAFTLLELLIAIAIIGILASLILTVAGSANAKSEECSGHRRHQRFGKGHCRVQAEIRRRAAQPCDALRNGRGLERRSSVDGDYPADLAAVRLYL